MSVFKRAKKVCLKIVSDKGVYLFVLFFDRKKLKCLLFLNPSRPDEDFLLPCSP
jgi:hypothetical protein